MNWWAKTNWDVRLTSKNSQRLTSKSTDSSLTRIHSDRGRGTRMHGGIGAHSCGLIMIMPFMLQSVPSFPTLYGPDLSHCFVAEAPLTLRTTEGTYALCLHATHSPQPHETFCQHAFMSPGWSQHHTERLSQLAVCAKVFGCTRHSVLQRPGTLWMSDRYEVEENRCLLVRLIRQSRPQFSWVLTCKIRWTIKIHWMCVSSCSLSMYEKTYRSVTPG